MAKTTARIALPTPSTCRDRTISPSAPLMCSCSPHWSVADGQIFVLIHDAAVGIAIVGAVVALFDQRPGFLLFLLLGIDEFFDVAVPVAQRIHLGGAAGFAAGFDDIRDLIVDLEERHGSAG